MDAKVPDAQIDLVVGEDFDQGVLAHEERLGGDDLAPVAAGEQGGVGLDEVLLTLAGAERADVEAGDDAGILADIDADDDVGGIGWWMRGFVGAIVGAVGVDGHGFAVGDGGVVHAQVDFGLADVQLHLGGLALEGDDTVRGGSGVEDAAQDAVAGLAIEFAVGLGEGDELGGVVPGVEDEDTFLLGELEVGSDLGHDGGAVRLLFGELGVEHWRWRGTGGVALLPLLGGVEIDQGEGDFFGVAAALGTDVADDLADDLVAHDDLVAAVLEDEAGAVRGGVGRGDGEWLLLGRGWIRPRRQTGGQKEYCDDFAKPHLDFPQVLRSVLPCLLEFTKTPYLKAKAILQMLE